MEIRYTNHAAQRIRERNISIERITATLQQPEHISEELEGVTAAYKRFRKRSLKVIYVKQQESIRIITVYWTSIQRMKGTPHLLEGKQ